MHASSLILLLPSLALNSRIRDPFTLLLLEALKYGARDSLKNKLYENINYYFTESIKLAYIKGLIRSKAIKHIFLRLKDNIIDLYTTIQDLFEHLTFAYKNSNRLFTAKNEFKKLFIKLT